MKTKRRELITVALVIGLIAVTAMAYMIYTNKFIGNKNITDNGNSSENRQALAEGETWTAETLKATVDTSTWDLNKVNIVESADGIPVPVPKGFFASELEGENTVLGGFVIYSGEEPIKGIRDEEGNLIEKLGSYDKTTNKLTSAYSTNPDSYWQASCTRNQYVWVPIPDYSKLYEIKDGKKIAVLYTWNRSPELTISSYSGLGNVVGVKGYDDEITLKKYNVEQNSRQELAEYLETEFESTMDSIEKYGGFYIGRYENGRVDNEAVVQRMNNNNTAWSWYEAYNKIPKMEKNNNVKVSLIWENLWQQTILWLANSGRISWNEATDYAHLWGNYGGYEREYLDSNGNIKKTSRDSSGTIICSGSSEYFNSNNIYDLSGNLPEWTLSVSINQFRFLWGGSYNMKNNNNYGGWHQMNLGFGSAPENTSAYTNQHNDINNWSYNVNSFARPTCGCRACFYIK